MFPLDGIVLMLGGRLGKSMDGAESDVLAWVLERQLYQLKDNLTSGVIAI